MFLKHQRPLCRDLVNVTCKDGDEMVGRSLACSISPDGLAGLPLAARSMEAACPPFSSLLLNGGWRRRCNPRQRVKRGAQRCPGRRAAAAVGINAPEYLQPQCGCQRVPCEPPPPIQSTPPPPGLPTAPFMAPLLFPLHGTFVRCRGAHSHEGAECLLQPVQREGPRWVPPPASIQRTV